MVALVLLQHALDIAHVKCHLDIKIRRNIPRAVVLMLSFGTNFKLQILNIINAGEYDGLKSRHLVAYQKLFSQQPQHANKRIVVACLIHFVDDHNQWFLRCHTHLRNGHRKIVQANLLFGLVCLDSLRHDLLNFSGHIVPAHQSRKFKLPHHGISQVPLRLVGCIIKPLKADGIDLIITCQPHCERVERRGFAELPPAIDAEIGAVIHHRLDLRNATGQIDHVVLVGKTGSGDVELFHCIDSIRLNSSPIIGRWITYHNDTLFCEKCAGCFVARLLAFANTPRRSGYRLRRYALLRVPMCSTV